MRNRAQLPQKAMASAACVTRVTPEQPTSTPNMSNDQLHRNRDNTAESKPHGKGKGKAREENPAGLSWGASKDTHMATQAPIDPLQVPTHVGWQPPKKKKTRPTQAQRQQCECECEDTANDAMSDDSITQDLSGIPNPHAANLRYLLNMSETDDVESPTTLPAQSDITMDEPSIPQ